MVIGNAGTGEQNYCISSIATCADNWACVYIHKMYVYRGMVFTNWNTDLLLVQQ